jgi:hypothetical protein
LRTAGSEMDIGDKQSAKAPFRQLVTHNVIPMREQLTDSRDSVMTIAIGTFHMSSRVKAGESVICPCRMANSSAVRQPSVTGWASV